ncbi:hypothetical protein CEXT_658961 [Caerostris extrusa]|uniref:Secreted protein n=1 Tax=Caerostris extrusa TaxID=172846 RepID=A0AAV4P425_CAEEX|nr:hypothetical protein CEXT_658961 [Caerostris extrusa]
MIFPPGKLEQVNFFLPVFLILLIARAKCVSSVSVFFVIYTQPTRQASPSLKQKPRTRPSVSSHLLGSILFISSTPLTPCEHPTSFRYLVRQWTILS